MLGGLKEYWGTAIGPLLQICSDSPTPAPEMGFPCGSQKFPSAVRPSICIPSWGSQCHNSPDLGSLLPSSPSWRPAHCSRTAGCVAEAGMP